MKIVLKNVRCNFPNVFRPVSFNGGTPRYSVQVILPKDHPQIKALKEAILSAAKEKWSAKIKDNTFPRGLKDPLRDGDVERDTEENPEYKGQYFFNASSTFMPGVFDKNKTKIDEGSHKIHSGCYINISLNTYPFDVAGNKGVALGLNGLQFHAEGESIGGYTGSESDFDAEESDDFEDIM